MYIDSAAIITIASVLGALTAIGAVAYKIIKWFQAQEKQTTDIEDLKKQEKEDIKAMEDELCLLTYAVSVSYTHLDVYKRQVLTLPEIELTVSESLPPWKQGVTVSE